MTQPVLTPPPGRALKPATYVVPSQNSHAIPKQLFQGADIHDLLRQFKKLPNWENAFDFLNGPENTQRLPASGNPNGDSAHLGSHPSINEQVRFKLDALQNDLTLDQAFQADRQLADNGDVAAQGRVRDRLAREFRTISFDIQFKSTQFMNDPSGQVGRLIW